MVKSFKDRMRAKLPVTIVRGARAKLLGALVLGGALVILPVTLRNRVVAGEWVLVTDSGGLNLYIGNGRGAIGTFRMPQHLPRASNARSVRHVSTCRGATLGAAAHRAGGRLLLVWRDLA